MDMETLDKANKLRKEIFLISENIKRWDRATPARVPDDEFVLLAYEKFNSNLIPEAAYAAFREGCINHLKVRKAELEAELAAL